MCGDFNVRQEPEMEHGTLKILLTCFVIVTVIRRTRRSNDTHVNTFENQLIDLCDMYECMILNGLIECGFDGSYTYISKTVQVSLTTLSCHVICFTLCTQILLM